MPPRIVTASIVGFWLFTLGWFAYREWLPWLRADSPPPFTVELVDEAAPLIAHWKIWRGDKMIGSLTTRMTAQKDDTFELYSSIENLAVSGFKVQKLTTVQKVTRTGQLLSFHSKLEIEGALGKQEFRVSARLEGNARDGKLFSRGRIESPLFGTLEQDLEAVPLESGSLFNPMQPLAKLDVRPGQTWKITNFDPMGEALKATARKFGLNFALTEPTTFLAQVRSEPVTLTHQNRQVKCHVIEYRSKEITGQTWAQVADGKVLRQEVTNASETLVLLRDD